MCGSGTHLRQQSCSFQIEWACYVAVDLDLSIVSSLLLVSLLQGPHTNIPRKIYTPDGIPLNWRIKLLCKIYQDNDSGLLFFLGEETIKLVKHTTNS